MLKRIALWGLVGISLVLAGCVVPSVYPFYTGDQLAFDPALVGAWVKVSGNDTNTWTFEKTGDKEYKLTIADPNDPFVCTAHLFKMDGKSFMDCVPNQKFSGDLPGIPSHYLVKVTQIQPTLKWSTLNYKWANELLEKNPGALQHTVTYGKPGDADSKYVIFTAETKDLQKFIRKHLDNTDAFVDIDEMKRAVAN